jgi:hypothetical protein
MWALTPSVGRADDTQKRYWKKIALQTCETGLRDPGCHIIYHYDLQKRIMKLEKSLKVVKREQHDFGHSLLAQPYERVVYGIKVEREEATVKNTSSNEDQANRRGRPTIWIDEREGGGECRVESMCLSWYRDQGWKGFHCESGIVRTLVGNITAFGIFKGRRRGDNWLIFCDCSLDTYFTMYYMPMFLMYFRHLSRHALLTFTQMLSIRLGLLRSTIVLSRSLTVRRNGSFVNCTNVSLISRLVLWELIGLLN